MRKLITKASAFALSGLMAFSSMPVYAAEPSIKYTDPAITKAGTSDCVVTIDGGKSSFEVTLPKTMDGDAVKGSINWEYTAKVEGDIAGNETVSVVPDAEFALSQTGKADVPATVTQEKTVWDVDDVINAVEETGVVEARNISAGTWTGTFNWNIKLEGRTESSVTQVAGLYDADGNLLAEFTKEQIETDYNADKSNIFLSNLGVNQDDVKKVIFPEGVTRIGSFTFIHCDFLESIIIPDNVTSIGDSTFYWCKNLTSITIPNSVTSIGESTFQHCINLTSITIPNGVTNIGNFAFYGCDNLTSITYKGVEYNSKSELLDALNANGVTYEESAFNYAGLQD